MSKLGIAITAVVCLPLGALLQRPASAQKRVDGLQVRGESHFDRAQDALREASAEIQASQHANEDLWRGDTARAEHVRDAIEHARIATDEAATWIGLDRGPYRRVIVRRYAP
ncbi:MAG TPA: hypothetical protein VGG74_12605 [Kofleriaceae bacterium]|jgi:hypothetical protein